MDIKYRSELGELAKELFNGEQEKINESTKVESFVPVKFVKKELQEQRRKELQEQRRKELKKKVL